MTYGLHSIQGALDVLRVECTKYDIAPCRVRPYVKGMLRTRTTFRLLDVPLAARNRALHDLAHETKLSEEVREQLAQVVHGYVGPCVDGTP